MTATNSDVINLVLQKVFVTEGGEAAEDDDFSAMQAVFEARVEYLRDIEVAWWASDAVPDGVKDPLAEYMTYFCPLLPKSERAAYREDSAIGLRNLRELASVRSDNSPIQVEYD